MLRRRSQQDVREIFLITRVSAPYRQYLVSYLAEELGVPVHTICLGAAYTESQGALWTRDPSATAQPGRLRAIRLHWRAGSSALKRIARSPAPGVIVHGYNDLAFVRVMASCKRRGIPVFLRGDSNIRDDQGKPRHRRAAKRLYLRILRSLVDGVMTVGTLGDEYYMHYGWDPAHLFPVPLSIDFEAFRIAPSEQTLRSFRLEAGITEDRRLILFSGRLEQVKRVDLLMSAFVDLTDELPEWDLVVAGSGALEDTLRRLVPTRLDSRVHWLGWCGQDRLKVAYHASDILVLPSEREAWAVVVNEAIAAGLIVIASDAVGAAADLIEDGVSGYLFASGVAGDLKRAIREAIRADESVQQHAADSYQRFWRTRNPADGVVRAFASVGCTVPGWVARD